MNFRWLWEHTYLRLPAFLVAGLEIRAFPISQLWTEGLCITHHHTVDPLVPFGPPSSPFSSNTWLAFALEPLRRACFRESELPGLFLMDSGGLFQGGSRAEFQREAKTLRGQKYPTFRNYLGPGSHYFTNIIRIIWMCLLISGDILLMP